MSSLEKWVRNLFGKINLYNKTWLALFYITLVLPYFLNQVLSATVTPVLMNFWGGQLSYIVPFLIQIGFVQYFCYRQFIEGRNIFLYVFFLNIGTYLLLGSSIGGTILNLIWLAPQYVIYYVPNLLSHIYL